MVQTLSLWFAVQSHHVIQMLSRDHRSARELNLGFVPLESEQVLLQSKLLSYLCRDRPEQQSVIHSVKQQPTVRDPKPKGQP